MVKVLQLAQAGIENAKDLYRWRLFAHICTILIGMVGIFVPDTWAIALGILALITEGTAWFLNYYGNESHTLGRKGLRRAILMDAYGTSETTLDIADLKRKFGTSLTSKAEVRDVSDYYGSTLPQGNERFRENLQESAFWSSHLFGKAGYISLVRFILFVIASFIIISATAPYLSGEELSRFFQVVILFLSFLPASEELRNMFSWWSASAQTLSVRDRLEGANLDEAEQLLTIFGDYVAAVEAAPPIPTSLHKRERNMLNRLWSEYKSRT